MAKKRVAEVEETVVDGVSIEESEIGRAHV